jgi:hypothetical protein
VRAPCYVGPEPALAASMLQTQRSEYLSFRRKFEPASVKLVIVAESPPATGKYFYNPTGAVSEHLFAALMLQLGFAPTSKESGLREFQKGGGSWWTRRTSRWTLSMIGMLTV